MNNNANESIACIVNECKYHSKDVDYCTLNQIRVVKHEGHAATVQCTDCGSFEVQQ